MDFVNNVSIHKRVGKEQNNSGLTEKNRTFFLNFIFIFTSAKEKPRWGTIE